MGKYTKMKRNSKTKSKSKTRKNHKVKGGYKPSNDLKNLCIFISEITKLDETPAREFELPQEDKFTEIQKSVVKNKIIVDDIDQLETAECIQIVIDMQENLTKIDQLFQRKNPFSSDKQRTASIQYLIENAEKYKKILANVAEKEGNSHRFDKTLKLYPSYKTTISNVKLNDVDAFDPKDKTVTISFFNSFLGQMKDPPENTLGKLILSVKEGTSTMKKLVNSITDVDELMATIHYGMRRGEVKPFYRKRFTISDKPA